MYRQDSFVNSPSKALWVLDEVSVLIQGVIAPCSKLILLQKATAYGVTKRFVLRKEVQAPKPTQSQDKSEIYARFAMIFGSHDDASKQPPDNKRLSVLDECEEEVESDRRDTMYEEEWDETVLQSIVGMHALETSFEPTGLQNSTRCNSWKNRLNSSSARSNTSLSRIESHDIPTLDRAILKTVTHTATFEHKTPASHQHGTEDFPVNNVDETATSTPLCISFELERERMRKLFDDDLHQKRLELIREKYALPEHSHVFQGANDSGLRRMTGGFQYRMKTWNNSFMALFTKHCKVGSCAR